MSMPVRIDDELYEQAKADAASEHRSIAGQIEFWAKVGRAALDNPDLPASFIAESLIAMACWSQQSPISTNFARFSATVAIRSRRRRRHRC